MANPVQAHCSRCNASIRLFTEVLPEKCPQCSSKLKYEEFDKCESCGGKVTKGVQNCVSCRMARDPSNSGPTPSSSGMGGAN